MRDDDTHTEDQWHDHMRAIERIGRAFSDEQIGVTEKRRLIADENARYYGTSRVPRELTRTGPR